MNKKFAINNALSLVLISIGFFGIADFGILSGADAAWYAIVLSLVRPDLGPYLLIMLSSIQDARGLTYSWSYIGFGAVACIVVAHSLREQLLARGRDSRNIPDVFQGFTRVVALAVLVVIYGFVVSATHSLLSGMDQSPTRPYYFVALLMLIMILSAFFSLYQLYKQPDGMRSLSIVALLCIAHSLLIAVLQIFTGHAFFRSITGLSMISEALQLTEASAMGIPRLTGSYLSPNALALTVALYFMLILGSRHIPLPRTFPVIYAAIGILLGVITLSKAMILFFFITAVILTWHSRFRPAFFLLTAFAVIVAAALLNTIPWESISSLMRLGSGGSGYRELAWEAVLEKFGTLEFTFGAGLSHWPLFFSRTINIPLADPHTYLLSICGTFGILGVLFYSALAVYLLNALIILRHQRALILFILTLLFVKDLFSAPYVLGNVPITFLIWLCLGLALDGPEGYQSNFLELGSSDVAHR